MKRLLLSRPLSAGGALLLFVLVAPWLTGCSDESLTAPETQDDRFTSYVALGNSITAGFQSGGINSQTQSESYAVLLAEQMGTPFGVPELNPPGCPPPLQLISPQPSGTQCGLRSETSAQVKNVAVPGAALFDVLSNEDPNGPDPPPGPNQLTQFVLGGRTQIQAALDVNPTFATVWIGNNDVLGAANAGSVDLATSPTDFEARYRTIADSLNTAESLRGAVLVGVADVSVVPGIFPGEVYLGLAEQIGDQLPDNFDVSSTCAPDAQGGNGTTNQTSFLFALNLISQARQNPGDQFTLGCRDDDPGALTPEELGALSDRTSTYNSIIASIAEENGWGFYDPNGDFQALEQEGRIPQVPDFTSNQPFGRFFSLDGVHPSSDAHEAVANCLINTINRRNDSNSSLQEIEGESCPTLQ